MGKPESCLGITSACSSTVYALPISMNGRASHFIMQMAIAYTATEAGVMLEKDRSMWTGNTEKYYWLISSDPILLSYDIFIEHHIGHLLHITSFDSDPLLINQDEKKLGWTQKGSVAVSPPIEKEMEIPRDHYDEWYISDAELTFPTDLELFVNFGTFNLAHPKELTKDDDPSWEKGRCDYLYPLQERFWEQLLAIQPETYIASGDLDIYLSKNEKFIQSIHSSA